jgi:hypothetical protein
MKQVRLLTTIAIILLFASVMIYGKEYWTGGKIFTNAEGNLQIEVPPHWGPMDLNPEAAIQVGSLSEENYFIVIPEAKVDLHGWNIDKHSKITLGNLLYLVDFPEISEPEILKINGHPAIQYEIHGGADGINITYILTTIETPEYYNQILAWTLTSRYQKNKKTLKRAIESLQEVPAAKNSKQLFSDDGLKDLKRL